MNVLLPRPAQVWFQSCFPEWALPGQLVLKKQKDGWDEEFETEKAMYAKLAPLQDVVIPRCFGQLRYEGTRALLLSDIGGVCLATPEGGLLDLGDFRRSDGLGRHVSPTARAAAPTKVGSKGVDRAPPASAARHGT